MDIHWGNFSFIFRHILEVKKLRIQDITSKELSLKTVQNIIEKQSVFYLSTFLKLCRALGVSPQSIMLAYSVLREWQEKFPQREEFHD